MLKKLLLTCILIGSLTISGAAPPDQEKDRIAFEVQATDYVCQELYKIDAALVCPSDMRRPTVIVTWLVAGHYLNAVGRVMGMHFRGEPYVFVRPDLSPEQTVEVALHEITHYVLEQIDPNFDRCRSEDLARRVTKNEDDSWRERYGCKIEVENGD